MDRGAWWAVVHGVERVGHDLTTKPPPWIYFLRKQRVGRGHLSWKLGLQVEFIGKVAIIIIFYYVLGLSSFIEWTWETFVWFTMQNDMRMSHGVLCIVKNTIFTTWLEGSELLELSLLIFIMVQFLWLIQSMILIGGTHVKSVVFLIAFFSLFVTRTTKVAGIVQWTLVPLRNSACRIRNFCKFIILFRDFLGTATHANKRMCFSFWCQAS